MVASVDAAQGPPLVPSMRLDSASLPRAMRVELLREAMGTAYEPELPNPAGFSIASDAWLLGGMLINSRTCSPIHFSRTKRQIRCDGLDHYLIMVTRAGTWSADFGAAEAHSRSQTVVVLDMAAPLDIAASVSLTVGCTVPRETLDRLVPGGIAHGTMLLGAAAGLLADYIALLERRLPELSLAEAPHIERATAEMMAACIAPAAARMDQAAGAVAASLRRQAMRLIEARLHDPSLSADQIATSLKISRATLYRLFQDHGGVDSAIWSRRLNQARRMLADPAEHRRISQIAAACGFQSDAHFSRAFRRMFDTTPSDIRNGRGRLQPPAPPPAEPVPSQYHRWLCDLSP